MLRTIISNNCFGEVPDFPLGKHPDQEAGGLLVGGKIPEARESNNVKGGGIDGTNRADYESDK